MEFVLAIADELTLKDDELAGLLTQVYVDGGYTEAEEAHTLFAPDNVRRRGILITAREKATSRLAGMIILVPHDSPACRRAGKNEAEIHLLAVTEEYRGAGLGRRLVDEVIARATKRGYGKLILWTQPAMTAAQRLYASSGFVHVDSYEHNGRQFQLYEKSLTT